MHQIMLKMKLANPNPTGSLKDHLKFLKAKLDEMNSLESNYNQKKVTVVEPFENDDTVVLKVESELELSSPGRAFTGLSRSLLNENSNEYDSFFKENLWHGRLFSFERIYKDYKVIDNISDTDFLVRVLVLIQKPKSLLTQTERNILSQMKILAANLTNDFSKGEKE